jgi:hypothetical protein
VPGAVDEPADAAPERRTEREGDGAQHALDRTRGLERSPQRSARTPDPRSGVDLGDPECACDFLVGPSIDQSQLERSTLRLGQLADRPLHRCERDVVGNRLLALVGVALDHPVGERKGPPAACRDVRADVEEDGVQPRREPPVTGVPEAVEREKRSKKGLLDGVLGILDVAQPMAGSREQRGVMGADDLGERLAVTPAVRGDQPDRAVLIDARDIGRR